MMTDQQYKNAYEDGYNDALSRVEDIIEKFKEKANRMPWLVGCLPILQKIKEEIREEVK
jgi:hypothetical protein